MKRIRLLKIKSATTILSLMCSISLLCQNDTIIVKSFNPNQILCENQVTLPDSVKNGYIKCNTKEGKPLVSGQYTNNQRSGIWIWYENKNVRYTDTSEIYDYDKKKVIFCRDTSLKGPRYPGGYNDFTNDIRKGIKIPKELLKEYDGKKIIAVFSLSCEGKVSDISFHPKSEFKNSVIESLVIDALKQNYDLWIPCKDSNWWNTFGVKFNLPLIVRDK